MSWLSEACSEINGQLDAIHTAVIERAIATDEAKFIWPMTWLFQVVRISDATFFKGWEDIYNYDEDIMNKYLFETVEWRRALADKFGERDLS